jgi:thymidylate kinase
MHPPEHPSFERYREALEALILPGFGARAPGTPFIVALEGPNGAGKTTLCAALAGSLGAPYCLGIDSAWFLPAFKTRMIRDAEWFASAMFFLSGCFEQARGLSANGAPLVIMDRSLWSTLAVHAAERIRRLEAILTMLRPIAAEIRAPDLTLVLEASFETCQTRISQKEGVARALDALTATQGFYNREREFYRWLGRQVPTVRFLNVDALTADEALAAALALVRGVEKDGAYGRG